MGVARTKAVGTDAGSRVAAVAARHEHTLLRVARQASLCHDDALDAVQRALEIFVRRVDTVDPATEVAWLKVVVRHEAMAIRRARSESVNGEDLDLDAFLPGTSRSVEDVIAGGERVRRSAEALRALKPDEATALLMKAHGLSYDEIGARNGWSYTKVNRAVTEGRRRFLAAYEGIETGEECERYAPIVEALGLGEASAAQVLKIRPHLRHCAACRAAVRDLHLSRVRRASLLWPGFLFGGGAVVSADERVAELAVHADLGRSPLGVEDLPNLLELSEPISRMAAFKHDVAALLHRLQASDVATSIHLALTGGGGRLATLGAFLGLCLSGAGAATVCVVTGLVPGPLGLFDQEPPPLVATPPGQPVRKPERPRPKPTPTPSVAQLDGLPDRPSVSRVPRPPGETTNRRKRGEYITQRTASQQTANRVARQSPEFGFEEGASSPTTATAFRRAPQADVARSAAPQPQDPAIQEFDPAQQEFGP